MYDVEQQIEIESHYRIFEKLSFWKEKRRLRHLLHEKPWLKKEISNLYSAHRDHERPARDIQGTKRFLLFLHSLTKHWRMQLIYSRSICNYSLVNHFFIQVRDLKLAIHPKYVVKIIFVGLTFMLNKKFSRIKLRQHFADFKAKIMLN